MLQVSKGGLMTKIHIKNMVCNRCISVVTQELKLLKLPVRHVALGLAELDTPLTAAQKTAVQKALQKHGFDLLDDKRAKIVERIKTLLIELVHYDQKKKPEHQRYSEYIADQIGMDYTSLSKMFSQVEGVTIEHYMISQKVERIKELLVYEEMNVSEIALQLGYSSVAHLSAQFRKFTGSTPTEFKNATLHDRKSLDKV